MTWTASEELKIAELMKEHKIERGAAIRRMRADAKIKPAAARKIAAVKAKKESKKGEITQHEPTENVQKMIDSAIRSAVKAKFGEHRAIETCLGKRNSNGSTGAPYQRYLLEGCKHTIFVGSWVGVTKPEDLKVTINAADPRSYTVAGYLARQNRLEERAAKSEDANVEKHEKKVLAGGKKRSKHSPNTREGLRGMIHRTMSKPARAADVLANVQHSMAEKMKLDAKLSAPKA